MTNIRPKVEHSTQWNQIFKEQRLSVLTFRELEKKHFHQVLPIVLLKWDRTNKDQSTIECGTYFRKAQGVENSCKP